MDVTSQTMEEFWGAALSKNNKEIEWETEDDEDDSLHFDKHLELRQACLGVGAKEGERNVVEVTTDDEEGTKVSYTILSMRLGGTEQSSLFVTLQPPVKFKLVEGSGPVHLVGQVTETIDLDSMLNDEEEEDDEEEEEEEKEAIKSAPKIQGSNKRPASSPSKAPSSKVTKMDNWDEDDSEEEEGSEEEDGEMSDEEEESDEEEVKPPPKKSQSNGKPTPRSKGKPGTFKTPQAPSGKPQKGSSVPQKGSRSLPNTPKAMSDKKAQSNKKKTPSGKGTPDLNEIKERLTKMSVPKKLEKFNNFVSNSFKIKDQSITKQLWEYVQKNRPEK